MTSTAQVDDFADIAKPHPAVVHHASADDFSDIAKPHTPAKPAIDFINHKGEGLYKMTGPDGKDVDVPYSKVQDASKAGYTTTQEVRERYAADLNEEHMKNLREHPPSREMKLTPAGPSTMAQPLTPATDLPKTEESPSTATPGWWETVRQKVSDATAPKDKEKWTNFAKRIGSDLFGMVDFPVAATGAVIDAVSNDPDVSAAGMEKLGHFIPPQQVVDRIAEFKKDWKKDPNAAMNNLGADATTFFLAHKAGELAPKAAGKVAGVVEDKLSEKYAPKRVEMAGEKVPVLVGEASPESSAGRTEIGLKRSGTGAPAFEAAEKVQYEKIKNVIRNTAQETSGLVGPMQQEPGAAMSDAATATFEQAKPMYAALDEELVTVPGDLHAANVLVKKAIARAKNLGYDFEASSQEHYDDEPLGLGKKIDAANQPLTTFMKIRSELGKMRAASSDGAFRHNVTEEMKNMTAAMDKALDNTGLKDMWKEADRLWAKGYALREIADTLNTTTKGTPPIEQAGELDKIPTEMQGARLVDKLNELRRDGTLGRAFTPTEASNLRRSADILDRIQSTPIGRSTGESVSQGRAIAHLLRGNAGPLIGAGVGFAVSHTPVGAEGGAALGFIAQRIGERALVNVMTKMDGVNALRGLSKAKTPGETGRAISTILGIAAAESATHHNEQKSAEQTVPQ